ncbi:hypothetical protein ACFY93_17745 [Streptomyces sp. NPDC008313]|uniref:hypothetical protein n=1 Tax=Streptomyces sp. NPDC008313 TaxID=3364826 RepID=UPI0036ED1CAA
MRRRTVLGGALEVLAWWAALTLLWVILISVPDVLEAVVGAAAALLCALVARGARRAVDGR